MKIVKKEELKKELPKPQKIFSAGYSCLTDNEKKEADKIIEK